MGRVFAPDEIPHARVSLGQTFGAAQRCTILDSAREFAIRDPQANLRILDVTEVKTVPYVPLSHPFVERLIGTIRRECLDRTLFWTAADLETKLLDFQRFYKGHRAHAGLDGRTPEPSPSGGGRTSVCSYRWQPHCRGLYQTPMAA